MPHIVRFDLGFPEAWHLVPKELTDPHEWARSTAVELVAGPAAGDLDAMTEDAVEVLAEQLDGVVRVVQDAAIAGLRTAFLVRHPENGVVDAMLTVGAQRDVSPDGYAAELKEVVEASETHDFAYAEAIEGTTAIGSVTGLHAMIAHPGELGEGSSAVLEERVVAGVFPEGTPDMVEVTAIARSVGSFDDMPQQIVDLLAGLTVEVGGS